MVIGHIISVATLNTKIKGVVWEYKPVIKQTDTEVLIKSRLFLTLWDIYGYISPGELMTPKANIKPSNIIVPCNVKD